MSFYGNGAEGIWPEHVDVDVDANDGNWKPPKFNIHRWMTIKTKHDYRMMS